ncbi:MAG: T9SS type A sorting domain-containing protein [Candidatus Latescibacteria bacterium]|nr:T9SS type A sorting domain-containing protein [Candidatus Latescibacterota bacterium]NIM21495.1 T9SS type A sorting domain-containing protein [Candidatus Latescibacterota bacterium]NIM65666.1 T9SS type A sorting domain-containing protein [Candidatus Latescibacterota bacterium]NIO02048.1 T9SS type A sorting domain-containing protein [Candidatus Latescibacterota bacterium]NIO28860.1 T9SS type A sorting domain-containing protein [Candidatus Latescibacterota bacterium]
MKSAKHLCSFRLRTTVILTFLVLLSSSSVWAQRTNPLIIDHTCCDITLIPESAITQAKASLHIGYGHTSHGQQVTEGMDGLITFANNGGLGLSLPTDIFDWNSGGNGGALDLRDKGYPRSLPLDVGYYPGWLDATREYLGPPDPVTGRGTTEPEVNVIMWAWCGQVDDKYRAGTLDSEYLTSMAQLEADYPGVTFVYMTGHLDIGYDASVKAGNQMIRDFCTANNKVLYDFADIESYNPDGTYFEFAHDNCNYYDAPKGTQLGNWAAEWQGSHVEGVDWFDCYSPHSEPLNANQKAFAAWWLFATLGGWDNTTAVQISSFEGKALDSGEVELRWDMETDENIVGFNIYRRTKGKEGIDVVNSSGMLSPAAREYTDDGARPGNIYLYTLSAVREDLSEVQSQIITVETLVPALALHQNYPNPFKGTTVIIFQVPEQSRVRLKVYNVQGQEIVTLVNGLKQEGAHRVVWDGKDAAGRQLSSGIYFYRLESDNLVQTRKMMVLR